MQLKNVKLLVANGLCFSGGKLLSAAGFVAFVLRVFPCKEMCSHPSVVCWCIGVYAEQKNISLRSGTQGRSSREMLSVMGSLAAYFSVTVLPLTT